MTDFKRGDIIRVPFPYTARRTEQRRPALVVSDGAIGNDRALLWVLMITSAANRPWRGDVAIRDHASVGLPAPSVVRTRKMATIEAGLCDRIGSLGTATMKDVERELRGLLAL